MNNFSIIYKILKALERNMGRSEFDSSAIAPEVLGIDKGRRDELLKLLAENEYISGLCVRQYVHSTEPVILGIEHMRITLRGLEYLEENSLMKKAARLAKGIADVVS